MGIDITAYDCWRPCEFCLDPKGEGVALSQDLNYFRMGTQIQPSLPENWCILAEGLKTFGYMNSLIKQKTCKELQF